MNVTWAGGYVTIYTGVFNQDTYIFAGAYVDQIGNKFTETYKLDNNICTNFEVLGDQCVLGCNAGVSCSNHSCSCGGAYGVWE